MDSPSPEPGTHVCSDEGRRITMAEHGRRTLVGGLPLELEPPGLPLMARIGREVDSDPEVKRRLGLRFIRTLAVIVRAVGDDDLTEKRLADRVLAVGQLSVPDWHYIALLQLAAVDAGRHTVEIDAECPKCRRPLPKKVTVDLHDVDVFVYDDPPEATYRFADEWRLCGQPVQSLTLGMPRLVRAIENATDIEMNTGMLQEIAWTAAAITHVGDRKTVVTAAQLSDTDPTLGTGMSPGDWDGLKAAFDDVFGGVSSRAPWIHEPCGEKLWIPVEWSDAFFGRSRG